MRTFFHTDINAHTHTHTHTHTHVQDTVKLYIADSFDQLPKLMDFFRGLLTRKTPVLIYSHCEVSKLDNTVYARLAAQRIYPIQKFEL